MVRVVARIVHAEETWTKHALRVPKLLLCVLMGDLAELAWVDHVGS